MSATDHLRRQLNVAIVNYCHERPFVDQRLQFRLCAQATAEVLADLITSASSNREVQRDLIRQLVQHIAARMEGRR